MADITIIPLPDGAAKKINDSLYISPRKLISIVSGTAAYSFTIDATAMVPKIILVYPALTGTDVTCVLSIENAYGDPIYESSALAENDTYIISPDNGVPLVGVNTVKLTCIKDPAGAGSAYVTLYLEGN